MFDKTLSLLERLSKGIEIPITLPTDEHGFLDRRCPAEACGETFKVHLDDWKQKVRREQAFCPVCRHEEDDGEWNTPEQAGHMKSIGVAYFSGQLDEALADDAHAFNARQPRQSFVKMSMQLKPGAPPSIVPVSAADAMELRVTCEACGCRYASVGAAFFCPACGHNSALTTFAQLLTTVRTFMTSLSTISRTVADSAGKDAARDFERVMVEQSLQRLVSAFQRFAEATFAQLPNAANFRPRRNLFQNLAESSDLWDRALGRRYEQMLTAEEMVALQRLFQQRHLLAHREGIVDQEYLDRSGDQTYGLGQRLVVKEGAVMTLANLVERLAQSLRDGARTPSP